MIEAITGSALFGIVLCLGTFRLGAVLQRKTKLTLVNPLLVSIILCILVIKVFQIPMENFFKGADVLNMLLPPATALLALNIYNQIKLLKKYALPVLVGCTMGSLSSMVSVTLGCKLLGIDKAISAALLPKSCTTPIAIEIAQGRGGLVPIAIVGVLIAGISGAVLAPHFAKIFKVDNPVAEGLAIGACSHAMGTTKAIEIGEVQGAMSGVAIGVCGLISVVLSMFLPV
ncbi:MAG: LrgB family protein [Oscillospiraceae bacterium]|nr:LrgB family protein [Oscillospiraceae bacterium]